VLVKEALANGRLGPRGDAQHRPLLEAVAAAGGVGVDAVAIAAALANPWAGLVLSGAVTPEQVRSNVSAAGLALMADDLARLSSVAEAAEDYWRRRSALAWS
jgi:aryl-alcohol dehydrogenase-like predicted oxidoreductase